MEKYKVFAGRLQAIPDGIEFSFYGERGRYMLVYAPKAPNDTFTEIPTEKEINLSDDERAWLSHCKNTVSMRFLAENKDVLFPTLETFIDRFREELENNRKELERNESKESGADTAQKRT